MIEKAKRDRLIFAVIGAVSFVLAIITAAVVVFDTIKNSNIPLVYLIISGVCFYLTPFMGFAAADRNSAIKLMGFLSESDSFDAELIGEKMGWKTQAVEKMLRSCEKWGYTKKR